MKLCVKLAAIAIVVASLSKAQSITLSIPALDQAGNPIPIGKFYATWQPFKSNSGVTVPGGAISSNITNGLINATLTASDNAGYVYNILIMNGATPNTFQWKVPAAGATTMMELNEPLTSDAGPSGPAGGDLSGTYPNPTIATGKPTLNNIGNPTAAKTFSMGSNFLSLTFGNATSGSNMFTATDSASNTGTGYVATIGTASGSSANPLQLLCQGVSCATMAGSSSLLTVGGASGYVTLGRFPAAGGTYGAVYFNQSSPDASNFAFLGSAADSYFNAPTGMLHFKVGNGAELIGLSTTSMSLFGDKALISSNGTSTFAGLQTATAIKATAYTATSDDEYLDCNTTAASFTLTLESTPKAGEWKTIANIGSNTCTVAGNGFNIWNQGIAASTLSVATNKIVLLRFDDKSSTQVWRVVSAY